MLLYREDLRKAELEIVEIKAMQKMAQTDLTSIKSVLGTITNELRSMRGWKQFLITGGIGFGWGIFQGICHYFGLGSAS